MATPDPNSTPNKPPKVKREYTDEQKKTITLLSIMGVLAVITAGIYVPPLFSHSDAPATLAPAVPEPTSVIPVSGKPGVTPPKGALPGSGSGSAAGAGAVPGATPGATPGAASGTAGGQPVTGTLAGLAVAPGAPPVNRYRTDPFMQFYSQPVQLPTPIPPIELPAPIELPSLRGGGARGAGLSDRDRFARDHAMEGLPSPAIPNLSGVVHPPSVGAPPAGGGNGETVQPAYNKRLSGVIIGGGVRALLEINNGTEIVTRVVQPGDEVDGIQVLSIQRVTEGNHTITRMIVRENGNEQSVDLAPSKQAAAPAAPGAAPPAGGTP